MAEPDQRAAELLVALAQLDDDQIVAFRRRHLSPEIALAELSRARRLARLLAAALGGDDDAWATLGELGPVLEDAADTVRPGATAPPPAPETSWPWGSVLDMSALHARAETLATTRVELDGHSMRLSEYAALCAACAAFPSRKRQTHAQFGIADDAARGRLDDRWAAAFGEEPALRELWQLLVGRFRAWLTQYGAF